VDRKKTTPMVVVVEVVDPGVVLLVEVERLDKVMDLIMEKHMMVILGDILD